MIRVGGLTSSHIVMRISVGKFRKDGNSAMYCVMCAVSVRRYVLLKGEGLAAVRQGTQGRKLQL